MRDIQKLHKVIGTLEEQSSKVSEFNGVLSAVNSAKADIISAKMAFDELAQEQKKLVSEHGDKLVELEAKLSALENNQRQTLAKLSELKVLTPEQFETGRDKILLRMSELRLVTPEQFEQGTSKVESMAAAQAQVIRSLRTLLVLGMLVLAGGIAYLAKDAFL